LSVMADYTPHPNVHCKLADERLEGEKRGFRAGKPDLTCRKERLYQQNPPM